MNTINHQNSNFFWYRAVIPFNQVRGFQGLHLDYYKLLKVNTGMNTNMGRNGFSSIERGFKVNFLQLFNKYSYKDSCGNFVKRGFSTSAINNSIIDNNNNNYNNNNNNKIFNDLISSKEFINSN